MKFYHFIFLIAIYFSSSSMLIAQDTIQIKFKFEDEEINIKNNFKITLKAKEKIQNIEYRNDFIIINKALLDSFKFISIGFKYKKNQIFFENYATKKLTGILKFGVDKSPFNEDNMNKVFDIIACKMKYIHYLVNDPYNPFDTTETIYCGTRISKPIFKKKYKNDYRKNQ